MRNCFQNNALVVLVGLILFFLFEYACFSAGRALVGVDTSLLLLLPCTLAGAFLGALLYDGALRLARNAGKQSFVSSGYALTLLGLSLGGAIGWIVSGTAFPQSALCLGLAVFCAGVPLAALLDGYFQQVPRQRQGLVLGCVLAAAECSMLVCRLLFQGDLAPQGRPMWLAFVIFGTGICAAIVLYAQKMAREDTKKTFQCPVPLLRQTLFYIVAIMTLFFSLHAIFDVLFYRYDSVKSPIPQSVGFYTWLAYPLLGFFLDRKGFGAKFFSICLGFCIVSPALTILSQHTVIYGIIFILDSMGRHGVFLFMTLILARYARMGNMSKILYTLPYFLQYSTYVLIALFFQKFHPGPGFVIIISFFICCMFSYISSKIHYAVAMVGYDAASPIVDPMLSQTGMDTTTDNGRERHQKIILFNEKYGLSPREADVMRFILQGLSINDLGQRLHISEHTVRSHIRNILRKTEAPSRNALIARFFNMP